METFAFKKGLLNGKEMIIVCKNRMEYNLSIHCISYLTEIGVLFRREPQKRKELSGLFSPHFS